MPYLLCLILIAGFVTVLMSLWIIFLLLALSSSKFGSPPFGIITLLHWKTKVHSLLSKAVVGKTWKPRPDNWLKANVDSTFLDDTAFSGVILKNKNGYILLAFTACHPCSDATAAESLAILDACLLLSKLKIKNIFIESYCLNSISCINGVSSN
ncbi:hypothetical protein CASFOL_010688 [Castilleja foliolosa]|uniref:RNase H type-1 domain-containing protein n=1 Tax=Castilleja foliolosa TaxID=1961234 RepID=A0ABD3DTC5_9LAMI